MSWKDYLKDNIVSIEELENNVDMTEEEKEALKSIADRHPMRITRYYYDLIDWSDVNDPIRKLSVPAMGELDKSGDYDTSGEASNTKMPGFQHKYNTTALVLSTNVCYMYCRHCFRKRMVGYSTEEIMSRMGDSAEYVRNHEEVNNVLITGGDSFTLSNKVIEEYLKHFSEIDHLDFIRFGTRVPVVFPHRIFMDDELLDILEKYNKKKELIIVTQFNHVKEITEEAKKAIAALKKAGLTVRNQTVLLKGINDNPEDLAELLNKLTSVGVHPYYVFQCRPVKFVKNHFQLPLYEGVQIVEEAKKKMNGLGKGFRYAMSHPRGKIEIFGVHDDKMIFKFHQNKYEEDAGKVFLRDVDKKARWLDEDLNPIV